MSENSSPNFNWTEVFTEFMESFEFFPLVTTGWFRIDYLEIESSSNI